MEMAGGDPDKVTLEMFCESAAQEHPDSVKLMLDLANILGEALGMAVNILAPVSYTHLDVYKRQVKAHSSEHHSQSDEQY